MSSEVNLFVRKASGLVRAWSVFDAFIYATFSINLITLGLFIFSYCWYFGGSLGTAVVVGGAFTIFEVIVYASLISAMPRAGGDYVWQSRILNRAIGFVLAMIAGVAAHVRGASVPGAEILVALSVIGLGVMLLRSRPMPAGAARQDQDRDPLPGYSRRQQGPPLPPPRPVVVDPQFVGESGRQDEGCWQRKSQDRGGDPAYTGTKLGNPHYPSHMDLG